MIKPILKTLSFAFVAFAAVAMAPASEPSPLVHVGATPVESVRFACSTQAEIDRGWEDQHQRVEKRLAEKEAEGLAVPGAIISPPFQTFAPYRIGAPNAAASVKGGKPSKGRPAGGRADTNRS